ncbi:outer membrane lipoprotein carrier protein LolA [Myceligenerans crystallogenes]|uniref:Sigma-E factor regulatory protein RseB domain-containing protein n=1 Tax=Myceligenerans crystallogenes TaxID=316335 RepID=A0ABN2NMR8_9MICO
MNAKTKALIAAGSGIAVGVTGLALTTMPAGADDAPVLPEISAEELVASTLEAEPLAFQGRAEVRNELGLPTIPGMSDVLDIEAVRVFHDGAESGRVQVERVDSELVIVKNTSEAWVYDSKENSAQHLTWTEADAEELKEHHARPDAADPSQAASGVIEQLSPSSDIVVDGTARVAGRPAYELVLTPKASEKTLLREVTVAVDSETRIPLRLEVFANGTTEPALSLEFTEFSVGEQDAELFEYTPPQDAEVSELDADAAEKVAKEHAERAGDAKGARDGGSFARELPGTEIVGDGWDAVLIAQAPEARPEDLPEDLQEDLPEGLEEFMGEGAGERGDNRDMSGGDMSGMLGGLGSPVSGDFGTGFHVETAVGGAIFTEDGSIAAGAVPQQVLVDALDEQ